MENLTVKEIRDYAKTKGYEIVGAWKMKKEDLIKEIEKIEKVKMVAQKNEKKDDTKEEVKKEDKYILKINNEEVKRFRKYEDIVEDLEGINRTNFYTMVNGINLVKFPNVQIIPLNEEKYQIWEKTQMVQKLKRENKKETSVTLYINDEEIGEYKTLKELAESNNIKYGMANELANRTFIPGEKSKYYGWEIVRNYIEKDEEENLED